MAFKQSCAISHWQILSKYWHCLHCHLVAQPLYFICCSHLAEMHLFYIRCCCFDVLSDLGLQKAAAQYRDRSLWTEGGSSVRLCSTFGLDGSNFWGRLRTFGCTMGAWNSMGCKICTVLFFKRSAEEIYWPVTVSSIMVHLYLSSVLSVCPTLRSWREKQLNLFHEWHF